MVAPVVLITTAAILSGALLTMYSSVNDRMRAMDGERLGILTSAAGTLLSATEVPPAGRERLTQIDTQLPMLLHRHRLLHNAVLSIYAGVAVLVLSVIAIGVAVTDSSGAAGTTALALVLAGTVTLLGGLLFAAVLGAEIAPDRGEVSDAERPADLLRGHADAFGEGGNAS